MFLSSSPAMPRGEKFNETAIIFIQNITYLYLTVYPLHCQPE